MDGNLKLIVERGVAPSEVDNEVVLSLFSPSEEECFDERLEVFTVMSSSSVSLQCT